MRRHVNVWHEACVCSLEKHEHKKMKYWIALLFGRTDLFGRSNKYGSSGPVRCSLVSELDENEPGYYKVWRPRSWAPREMDSVWVQGNKLSKDEKIIQIPDESGDEYANYRSILKGVDFFKDRNDIASFYRRQFCFTIVWVEVDEIIWEWLDLHFAEAVIDLLTSPKMDFVPHLENDGYLFSDSKLCLDICRHSAVKYPPKIQEALAHLLWSTGVPGQVSNFLLRLD